MATDLILRFRCDAPHCPAAEFGGGKGRDLPESWTAVSSTDHLAGWKPGQRLRSASGRAHADRRTYSDVTAGRFSLHLCGLHRTAFDEHQPSTIGGSTDRRSGDRYVSVACSCGWSRRSIRDLIIIHNRPEPHAAVELAWWFHLPADLQWYATREAVRTP